MVNGNLSSNESLLNNLTNTNEFINKTFQIQTDLPNDLTSERPIWIHNFKDKQNLLRVYILFQWEYLVGHNHEEFSNALVL